ncbi:MAG: hypothetical protein Q8O09_03030 [Bacillota bacterium]|nr:hypothetical protein [Bacillota bacterium]
MEKRDKKQQQKCQQKQAPELKQGEAGCEKKESETQGKDGCR